MTGAGVAFAVLAGQPSPDEVAPGWTALLIVAGLGVAVWLLWRSMNKQLDKVPPSFDEPAHERGGHDGDQARPPGADGPEDGPGAGRP